MLYASGLQGMDIKTLKLVEGGAAAETTQILTNLQALLGAAGTTMDTVVRCSVSLTNLTRDFKAMTMAYEGFWLHAPPARTAVQVGALAGNASVEIQCDAALEGSGRAAVEVPGMKAPPMLSWATTAHGMVYLSGAGGVDFAANPPKIVPGGVAKETAQALANIKQVLNASGSSPDRVVSCSVYLTDIKDFDAMNAVYKDFWPAHGPLGGLPSRVCVQVGALAGGAVEITCTAADATTLPRAVEVPSWPATAMPFSAGTTAGGIAYMSGSQGVDMKTHQRVAGGAGPETTQTLLNIQEVAEASGTKLVDVVACEVSLKSMEDFAAMNEAYKKFWPHDPPSRIAVQVGGLAFGAAVEIKCMAALSPSPALSPASPASPAAPAAFPAALAPYPAGDAALVV